VPEADCTGVKKQLDTVNNVCVCWPNASIDPNNANLCKCDVSLNSN